MLLLIPARGQKRQQRRRLIEFLCETIFSLLKLVRFKLNAAPRKRIRFDVVVEVQPLSDEIDDDVDRILSYDRVTEAIEATLSEERLNLLETLAERVAERILLAPQAQRVFVRIEKLDRGPGNLGVEIVRSKSRVVDADLRALEETQHPDRAVFVQ